MGGGRSVVIWRGRGCAKMRFFSFFPDFKRRGELFSGGTEDDAADDGQVGLFIPRLRIETWGTHIMVFGADLLAHLFAR